MDEVEVVSAEAWAENAEMLAESEFVVKGPLVAATAGDTCVDVVSGVATTPTEALFDPGISDPVKPVLLMG